MAANGGNHGTGIEGAFRDALRGDTLANALHFAAFLGENGMVAGGPNGEITYKDECIAYMFLSSAAEKPGPWTIWTNGDYSNQREGVPFDAPMRDIAWANVNFCGNCGAGCNPGSRKVILGREFEDVCSADMAFYCPDARTLACAEALLLMRKFDIGGAAS